MPYKGQRSATELSRIDESLSGFLLPLTSEQKTDIMPSVRGWFMKRAKVISLILAIFLLVSVREAWSAFNISATPYEGGYDLRFGKIFTISQWMNKE